MARRAPDGRPPPPVVQRLRLRYAKRGRLRFTSQRDFARAFERALRRANVPMAYSAGFTPHPKISYAGAAPTGVASEAEYLEIGLAREVEPDAVRAALDAALPPGLDVLQVVPACGAPLGELLQASVWQIELPGVPRESAEAAVLAFLARETCEVQRLMKAGQRTIDVRSPVVRATVSERGSGHEGGSRAILELVVRQVTPTVRPDDVLAALGDVAGLALAAPPSAVRVAQGPLDSAGAVGDPLAADRSTATASPLSD